MCDYSLQSLESRPAKVADKLVVRNFGTGTRGFAPQGSIDNTAVCVIPGTEIGFAEEIAVQTCEWQGFTKTQLGYSVGIFRQIEKDKPHVHHDAIELPNGKIVTINMLAEGQEATVLQLPAAPKTEQEAQEQTRLEVVA